MVRDNYIGRLQQVISVVYVYFFRASVRKILHDVMEKHFTVAINPPFFVRNFCNSEDVLSSRVERKKFWFLEEGISIQIKINNNNTKTKELGSKKSNTSQWECSFCKTHLDGTRLVDHLFYDQSRGMIPPIPQVCIKLRQTPRKSNCINSKIFRDS
jgi:hypothetical protein